MPAMETATTAPGLPRFRLPVVVTRPLHDALVWVERLRQAGFDARALPLIEITAVSAPAQLEAVTTALQSLHRYAACMFVSANAVEHFFKRNDALAPICRTQFAIDNGAKKNLQSVSVPLPPTLRMMAPGPGTADALLLAGASPAQIDSPAADAKQFDSEALWRVVGKRDWQGKRVLLVRGMTEGAAGGGMSSGRDWLSLQLQNAGASVDTVGVYQRVAPIWNAQQLQLALRAVTDGSVWLLSSSEAVANLLAMPGLQGVNWSSARALVTHPRIEAVVRDAGWGVVSGSRPALADIIETLASIESAHS